MGRLNALKRVPRLVLALAVAGATFGIVTAVQAAIPDSHGIIHGCYQFANAATPKGTLRVVDSGAGEQCRFTEKPLNWNSMGVAGVYAVAGQVDGNIVGQDEEIPADNPDWRFVATTAQVTVAANQSILANITAGLGMQECFQGPGQPCIGAPKVESSFEEFGYGVCFQNTVGGGEAATRSST